jgi:aspartyl-tRNA(Asn)/glutamyl-tRNA(Gln) amidotransferase subunit A
MHHLSIKQLQDGLKEKKFSATELTQHYLQRIKDHSHLNALNQVYEQRALAEAKLAEKRLLTDEHPPLTGIPLIHKDIFCSKEGLTTCSSKMLENYGSPFNATVVDNLQQQGTVLLGKANMDEFAMGSTNENSYFGAVKNPWHLSHSPGGSSGGSAAAVAARLAPFATGTDTGGSIRQPAAWCGVTGIKPTYGQVSRWGIVAFASSFDQAGPIAPSAEDCALVLNAMASADDKDSTCLRHNRTDFTSQLTQSLDGITIGLPDCFFDEKTSPAVTKQIEAAIDEFKKAGAKIKAIPLTLQPHWVPCYYVLTSAEASSNLSRFDGVRFGHRASDVSSLQQLITRTRSEGFGLEVKRRILTGTYVLSAGYFDAYFNQALKVRRLIRDELIDALNKVDVIAGPTSPTLPFEIGKRDEDPVKNYLADLFTVAANLAGFPAISIPVGFSQGLPIGMQLMGRPLQEATLLQVAHQYQLRTDWHQQQPDSKGAVL